MTDGVPQGRRFSHVYLSAGEPLKDSAKARFRIAKLAEDECPPSKSQGSYRTFDHATAVQDKLERDLGFRFATQSKAGTYYAIWEWYYNRISIVDFLDSITIITQYLLNERDLNEKRFINEARKIFKEENLAYQIDDLGGIHPLVDPAFSVAMQSAIGALRGERYRATADSIGLIDDNLIRDPPNYIGAIRAVFSANGNLFKLMYGVPRLDGKAAGEKLGPDQQSLYEGHPVQQSVSSKMLEAFKDWINAAHFYRHEQGVSTPNQPSEEVAVLMVSQGLSFVRWLAQIDKKRQ